jgi:transcriptional regulator with XRE-family HTH domain/energy-coupling factor transporter ATP-binding protein EcfA2
MSASTFNTFGDLLKYLRRRQRLTQLELSIAVGYSEAQISRLEQNQRLPDLAALKALFITALHIQDEPELTARLLELAQSARQEDSPAPGLPPYKGLLYFDESDSDLFFGRETLTAHLTNRITAPASDSFSNFLAVVGASGSGKSSLARAGLAVSLKRAGWNVHIFTPTATPMRIFQSTLEALPKQKTKRTLILVDQFEEAFTLCREESERIAFIEKLLAPSRNIFTVITLRAAFYSHCAQYPLLRQAVAAKQEYIGQMTTAELRRAIEEPAKRGGWDFEPGLVDLLLNDIGAHGTNEPEPGALPLLSHALLATWEKRRGRTFTIEGYRASGGVRGAIAETAESVFTDQLNQQQQELARDVFLRLTELGEGTEDTRRRAALNELVRQSTEAAQLRAVLNTLAEARLITLNEDSAEVSHEALIREWQRLHEWLTQDREGLRLHRHITEAAKEWEVRNRDHAELYRGARLAQAREWISSNPERLNTLERAFLDASLEWEQHEALERERQRQRELESARKLFEAERQATGRLRRVSYFLSALLLVVVVLAGFAFRLNRLSASKELAAASANQLSVDPELSILLALEALNSAHTREAEEALHEAVMASRIVMRLELGGEAHTVAYSPDGSRIVAAGTDGVAKVWDVRGGRQIFELRGHRGSIWQVAFSPNSELIATASDDATVKLWDANSGKLIMTLNGHTASVGGVAFSPDGY